MHLSKSFSVLFVFTLTAVTALPVGLFREPLLTRVPLQEAGILVPTSADHGLPDEHTPDVDDETDAFGDLTDDGPLFVTSGLAPSDQDENDMTSDDSENSTAHWEADAAPGVTLESLDTTTDAGVEAAGEENDLEALDEFSAAIEPDADGDDAPLVDEGEYDGGETSLDDDEFNDDNDFADEDEDVHSDSDIDSFAPADGNDEESSVGNEPTPTVEGDELESYGAPTPAGSYAMDGWDAAATATADDAEYVGESTSPAAGDDAGMTEDGDLFAVLPEDGEPTDIDGPQDESPVAAVNGNYAVVDDQAEVSEPGFVSRRPIPAARPVSQQMKSLQGVTDENGMYVVADDSGMARRHARRGLRLHSMRKRTSAPEPKVAKQRHFKRNRCAAPFRNALVVPRSAPVDYP